MTVAKESEQLQNQLSLTGIRRLRTCFQNQQQIKPLIVNHLMGGRRRLCYPFRQTAIHLTHISRMHSHRYTPISTHTHTVCLRLLGPQADPWLSCSRWCKVSNLQQPWRVPSLGAGQPPRPPSPTANRTLTALLLTSGLGLLGQTAD